MSLGGFAADLNGIISSFAITLVPEFDAVIRNGDSRIRLCPLCLTQPATRNCGFGPHTSEHDDKRKTESQAGHKIF